MMDLRAALSDGVILRLGLIFLFVATGFYGYTFWAPLVAKSLLGLSDLGVGFVLSGISVLTIVGMRINGTHSDRTGERPWHIAVPSFLMGVGFVACALLRQPILALVALSLVPLGHCSSYGPFWSLPTQFLTGRAAAAGIAMITMIANVGGFAGPWLMGVLKTNTGTHRDAFLFLGALAILAALIATRLRPRLPSSEST